jgi:hypothetical protein
MTAVRAISPSVLRPGPRAIRRALIAGSAWGIGMGTALTALKFQGCGIVCLSDVVLNTAIACVAGMFTIGPIAAFARPQSR